VSKQKLLTVAYRKFSLQIEIEEGLSFGFERYASTIQPKINSGNRNLEVVYLIISSN
jgi:hypothetical protein